MPALPPELGRSPVAGTLAARTVSLSLSPAAAVRPVAVPAAAAAVLTPSANSACTSSMVTPRQPPCSVAMSSKRVWEPDGCSPLTSKPAPVESIRLSHNRQSTIAWSSPKPSLVLRPLPSPMRGGGASTTAALCCWYLASGTGDEPDFPLAASSCEDRWLPLLSATDEPLREAFEATSSSPPLNRAGRAAPPPLCESVLPSPVAAVSSRRPFPACCFVLWTCARCERPASPRVASGGRTILSRCVPWSETSERFQSSHLVFALWRCMGLGCQNEGRVLGVKGGTLRMQCCQRLRKVSAAIGFCTTSSAPSCASGKYPLSVHGRRRREQGTARRLQVGGHEARCLV